MSPASDNRTARSTVTDRPVLTALRAGWLFDGTGAAPTPEPLVVVDGERIVSVQTGGAAPEGADVVDLGDATLLPGLVDTHVHLAFDASGDPVGNLAGRDDEAVLEAMRTAGRAALAGGVTTVRDLGDRSYLSLTLRGERDLPTLVAAGPPITTPGGHCHFLGGVARPGIRGARDAVREHADRGADVIKVMASGGTLTTGTRQELSQFLPKELCAAVEEAHRLGLPVTAHAHGTQAVADAVAAGVDGIEHASFWSATGVDEPLDLMALIISRGIVIGATVGMEPVPGAMPPPEVLRRLPLIIANGRRLVAGGARIVAGTDAGIGPGKPPYVVRFAPTHLMDLGLSGLQALHTITGLAAEVCGLADRKGRVAPGYDADLLAVDGDPLTEPAALHRIRAVYRMGRDVRPRVGHELIRVDRDGLPRTTR